jgi:hypothetical protein
MKDTASILACFHFRCGLVASLILSIVKQWVSGTLAIPFYLQQNCPGFINDSELEWYCYGMHGRDCNLWLWQGVGSCPQYDSDVLVTRLIYTGLSGVSIRRLEIETVGSNPIPLKRWMAVLVSSSSFTCHRIIDAK